MIHLKFSSSAFLRFLKIGTVKGREFHWLSFYTLVLSCSVWVKTDQTGGDAHGYRCSSLKENDSHKEWYS